MLSDTHKIKKETFRYLVIALFVSFAYDAFWLLMSASDYSRDQAGDGGVERRIRGFSLTMSVINILFRVMLNNFYHFNIVCCNLGVLEGFNRFLEDN